MHKIFPAFLVFILATQLHASGGHRGGAELLNPKAFSVNSKASFFKTSSFFDYKGVEESMVEGDQFSLIDFDLVGSYGISKDLEVSAFGRFRQVSSTFEEEIASTSGLESLGIEAKYAIARFGNITYAIGVHYRQTLYTNKNYIDRTEMPDDTLVLGDSGSEYGADLYMTYLQSPWKLDGKIGYSSPANFLSSEINYKLEIMHSFSKLALFGGVEGIYSLKQDEFSEEPGKKAVQKTGGTKLFNSINREYVAPYIGANYSFDKFIIGLQGKTILSGISTDKGNAISLSIGWNSDGITPESVKIGSFKEYQIDGSVLKVSAKKNFVRIDQGISTDVEKGMKFDIYQTDYFGGNVLVASGVVYQVGPDWSVIKLLKKYKAVEIKPGFAARGY